MATQVWLGAAQQVPQVNTVTPASVGVGNTFTVTINNKTVSVVATDTTVATTVGLLVTALQNSQEPEFEDLTYANLTTAVQITGKADGTPFTQTSSAAGGSATLTTATTTAGAGPAYESVAANWQSDSAPVAGDTLAIDNSSQPITFNLDQHTAGTLAAINIGAAFTGTIGLPQWNPAGYAEYRPTYLQFAASSVQIGQGNATGGGSGRIKWDAGSVQTALTVYNTGQPLDTGLPAMQFKGTNANNVVTVIGGFVGLACQPGEVSTALTLQVGGGQGGQISVIGGVGLTLTTLNQNGGTVALAAGLTTVNQTAGKLTVTGTGACTTINNYGGTVIWNSSGNITTINVSDAGIMDFSGDDRPITVTNVTLLAGATWNDPNSRVTVTNGIVLYRCGLADVTINVGIHKNLAITAGP